MASKKTTEQFIEQAKNIHGDLYDYSLVDYKNSTTPVKIICHCKDEDGNEHGVFEQIPRNHLQGDRCPKCFRSYKKTTDDFIKQANEVHGNKYDYSKTEYKSNKTPIIITCPKHGDFLQTPLYHLQGHGCQKCYNERRGKTLKKSNENFVSQAKEIHGDKYDYSKTEYVGSKNKVCIICPKHGEFWQTPNKHLSGQGCPKCGAELNGINKRISLDDFIKRSCDIHNNKYDYSKVVYEGWDKPVVIICPKHGEFKQIAGIHMSGCGCPICNQSYLERILHKLFETENISFETQKKFPFLGKLSLDFYLPFYNVAVECQGSQHYSNYYFNKWGGCNSLESIIARDKKKKELCSENGITIYYYANNKKIFELSDIYNVNNTFLNKSKLIEKIKGLKENKMKITESDIIYMVSECVNKILKEDAGKNQFANFKDEDLPEYYYIAVIPAWSIDAFVNGNFEGLSDWERMDVEGFTRGMYNVCGVENVGQYFKPMEGAKPFVAPENELSKQEDMCYKFAIPCPWNNS